MDGIDKKTLKKIKEVFSPHSFSSTRWTITNLIDLLRGSLRPRKKRLLFKEEAILIKNYFSLSKEERQKFENIQGIEKILKNYVKKVLREESFCFKVFGCLIFPPLYFKLIDPPTILVISCRNKLECSCTFLLKPNLSIDSIEKIESQIGNLGISPWLGPVGGLSCFPFIVDKCAPDIKGASAYIAHEWVHHHLSLKTLIGFFGLLTFFVPRQILSRMNIDPAEVRLINEGLADFFSQELTKKIFLNFPELEDEQIDDKKEDIFYGELRVIKQKVGEYLDNGEISDAENYMREMTRVLFRESDYFRRKVRKLNQASLSFFGNYDEANPLMPKFKEIRGKCSSLKEFLKKVSKVRSVKDLEKIN